MHSNFNEATRLLIFIKGIVQNTPQWKEKVKIKMLRQNILTYDFVTVNFAWIILDLLLSTKTETKLTRQLTLIDLDVDVSLDIPLTQSHSHITLSIHIGHLITLIYNMIRICGLIDSMITWFLELIFLPFSSISCLIILKVLFFFSLLFSLEEDCFLPLLFLVSDIWKKNICFVLMSIFFNFKVKVVFIIALKILHVLWYQIFDSLRICFENAVDRRSP